MNGSDSAQCARQLRGGNRVTPPEGLGPGEEATEGQRERGADATETGQPGLQVGQADLEARGDGAGSR